MMQWHKIKCTERFENGKKYIVASLHILFSQCSFVLPFACSFFLVILNFYLLFVVVVAVVFVGNCMASTI